MQIDELEYGPTTGVKALREAVAKMYNETYRVGKSSQYTYENVCIVPGGRAGLSRVAAVVGDVYLGFQVPDYTAYAQSLEVFRRLVPIPTALEAEKNYRLDIEQVRRDVYNQGLSVLLASNPRNPTGQLIQGDELKELVGLSKSKTTIILDEVCHSLVSLQPILSRVIVLFVVHLSRQPRRRWEICFWRHIYRRCQ
ncbi:hypothetical protein FRB91_004154 [Serendipita sp. 411]|nr:hypothetical protein FRB91_004154 [Serendipita sp. 411]